MKPLAPLVLLMLGLLAGCASYEAEVDRRHSLVGVQRYFVLTNPNDGHALDRQIAAALSSRGYQTDFGPLTMMPDETQAIVSYQDHWTWDFGDHLVYLQISVHDRKTNQIYASVSFSAKVPGRKSPAEIADGLVGRFLPAKT
jgi:hypothetical protein